jgi:hypothetical protein
MDVALYQPNRAVTKDRSEGGKVDPSLCDPRCGSRKGRTQMQLPISTLLHRLYVFRQPLSGHASLRPNQTNQLQDDKAVVNALPSKKCHLCLLA